MPDADLTDAEMPNRQYKGSPLQRYHQRQRLEAEARNRESAENMRLFNLQRAADLPARQQRERERQAGVIRHHTAKRRTVKLQRTPAWADMEAIKAIYIEARRLSVETGIPHHVDHAFPLQGRLVSGLHVHQNLQILMASANSSKSNHFEVTP